MLLALSCAVWPSRRVSWRFMRNTTRRRYAPGTWNLSAPKTWASPWDAQLHAALLPAVHTCV